MILNNADHIQNLSPSQNVFYRAVIENNNDGGVAGRCQVRILGIHSANAKRTGKNMGVPTADLPWAELMISPSAGGGMSGIGVTSVPLQGTWVWVFLDGGDWNKPIIVGIISGTSSQTKPSDESEAGFHDPDGVYPKEDRVGEPDTNRSSSGRNYDKTLISSTKDANRDEGVPTGSEETWKEPEAQSKKAEYTKNTVTETVSGNIIEMDETGGSGRMHWFHHTGTYWEVVGSGDYSIKIVSNYSHIVDGNTSRLNKGNEVHTVQGNSEYKIDGNRQSMIGVDLEETVMGTTTETYTGGQTTDGGPNITITAGVINLN